MPSSMNTICVTGAGTMGSGIAQVAAQSGFYTLLFDVSSTMLEKAKASIEKNLQFLAGKQKITPQEKETIFKRIRFITDANDCIADVVIEAIVENVEAKVSLFNRMSEVNHADAIFATNTSSLSVSAIQKGVVHPERVVGMHFFNPAPQMKLVEVVKGSQTLESVAQAIHDLCINMNKTPVMCHDIPGFIVNRVARHYYLEALKLVENGWASIEKVDEIMEASGFKMGPFRLMDLIGMDINLSVTRSLYEAFGHAERFRPSALQSEKVSRGELGKKTGKGFYDYNGS
jgi:3-hydroxybutyryl-CoA dehydrogenase